MEALHVVTAFLRDGGEILALRRRDGADSYPGRWDAITHAEGEPDRTAREAVCEATGLDEADVTLVRIGDSFRVADSFEVADSESERRWVVYPHLFDVATREVTVSEATASEWIAPTELRRRETVPGLWRSYERVSPALETIETDHERGSAALSISALRVLRDRAGVLADRTRSTDDGDEPGTGIEGTADDGWSELASLARALRDARPAMRVVANRVNRAIADADERNPRALERATRRAIERAAAADTEAAAVAAEVLTDRASSADDADDTPAGAGPRLLTLSRSGTVLETLRRLEPVPRKVVIAESRPGGEGTDVAEELASEHRVTLVADAGIASALCEHAIDAVLVGADTVFPDGSVSNKVGTRTTAIAAAYEGIPVYVVTASAKISPDSPTEIDREPRKGSELYDRDATVDVWNPTFDVTPGEVVTGICTERGVLAPDDVATIAAEFAARAWDEE